jgi:hypothetical protein
MSLLSICQDVCKDAGFAVPSQIIGNTDETALQLLALINKSGKLLARKPWQVLSDEHTFSTVIGTPDYARPANFGFYENDTAWDRNNYWKMRGSLSPQEWQRYKSGIQSTMPRQRFRIKKNRIYIDPTPTAAVALVLEYFINTWVTDGSSNYFTSFSADTQTSLIDETILQLDLFWRFLHRKGLAYAEAKKEAEDQIDLAMAHDVPLQPISLASKSHGPWPPLPTVPITGYS